MNDPRGILEEFVRACDGFRDSRAAKFQPEVDRNLDPESRRMAYRDKQRDNGLCIYCPRAADPETDKRKTKMCTKHLAYYRERARARHAALRASPSSSQEPKP